jgi:hypothetical protein
LHFCGSAPRFSLHVPLSGSRSVFHLQHKEHNEHEADDQLRIDDPSFVFVVSFVLKMEHEKRNAERAATLKPQPRVAPPVPGRLTLGLYNSYDARRFLEAHRRALVRAAPLALAFDANLATFGFPYDDLAAHGGRTAENRSKGGEARRGMGAAADAEPPELRTPVEIAEYIAGTTSVAGARGREHEEGDAQFVALARAGRFHVFDYPKKGFPPQLGTVVLTTEHAQCPKDTSARAIARDLVEGRSQLLLFGLGPQGTPADVRAMAQWEFDVTGGHVGLETATAMGAVVAAVAAHVEALSG